MSESDLLVLASALLLLACLAWCLRPPRPWEAELRAEQDRRDAARGETKDSTEAVVEPPERQGDTDSVGATEGAVDGPDGPADDHDPSEADRRECRIRRYGPRPWRMKTVVLRPEDKTEVDEGGVGNWRGSIGWSSVVRITSTPDVGGEQIRLYSEHRVLAFHADQIEKDLDDLVTLASARGRFVRGEPVLELREPSSTRVFRRRKPPARRLGRRRSVRRMDYRASLPFPPEAWSPWNEDLARPATVRAGRLIVGRESIPLDIVWRVVRIPTEGSDVVWVFGVGSCVGFDLDRLRGGEAAFEHLVRPAYSLFTIAERVDDGWRPFGARVWERKLDASTGHDERRWRARTAELHDESRPSWSPFHRVDASGVEYSDDGDRSFAPSPPSAWIRAASRGAATADAAAEAADKRVARAADVLGNAIAAAAGLLWVLASAVAKGGFAAFKGATSAVKGAKGGPTVVTMVASAWLYAREAGWGIAIPLVLLVLVHELGHGAGMLAKGVRPGRILFVPFVGALISLRGKPLSSASDAAISLAGPVIGGLASLALWPVYLATDSRIALAAFFVGVMLNLFNLLPLLPLDGGHVASAIHPALMIVGVVAFVGYGARFGLGAMGSIVQVLLVVGMVVSIERILSSASRDTEPYRSIPRGHRAAVALAYAATIAALAMAGHVALEQIEQVRGS